MTETDWLTDTRTSYDTVAESYADMLRDALEGQHLLLHLLGLFADEVRDAGSGPVADIGCGPGRLTAHLRTLGLDAFGIDLSPGMIAQARRDHPGIRFEVGSMTDLELADASLTGILSWFSIIHVPDDAVLTTFQHFQRVLEPNGVLLVGFHAGSGSRLKSEGYGGHPMKVYVHRRTVERVAEWLTETGFRVEVRVGHDPGDTTHGGMLLARRLP